MSAEDENNAQNPQDTLSQDEVDSLVSSGEQPLNIDVVYKPGGGRYPDVDTLSIFPFDFKRPLFITETELREMRTRSEKFIEYLNARLSMFLKLDIKLLINDFKLVEYAEVTQSIGSPGNITLFNTSGTTGIGLLAVDVSLSAAIVNRLLGGRGEIPEEERHLTEIENSIFEDVAFLILHEWCGQWTEVPDLKPAIVGVESNAQFLQTSLRDAMMMVLSIQANIGDAENAKTITIAVPCSMLEPLIEATVEQNNQNMLELNEGSSALKWTASYDSIGVPVYAEWDACEISVRDLLNLQAGDVVELPKSIIDNTVLRVKNKTQFKGEVGLENSRIAFKMREKIQNN